MAAENRHRHALGLLENGGKQVGGLDGLPAGPAGVVQRQLEDELGRGRDAQIASGKGRHHVQMFFNGLEDRVRIQVDVPHDFGEHVPLDLRKGQEQMLVGQQRVLAAASLLDRSVDDALRGFGNLAWRDVEIFYVHRILRQRTEAANGTPGLDRGFPATVRGASCILSPAVEGPECDPRSADAC